MHLEKRKTSHGHINVLCLNSDEFIELLDVDISHYTKAELLTKYKSYMDRSPDKFLQYHLENAVADEEFELAQYIKELADSRGVVLIS